MLSICFIPCYLIKLQISLLLSPINISKKRLGCSEKKREKENKRKRTHVPMKKMIERPKFFPKSSNLKERYVFLQGAKVELGYHYCHHISPFHNDFLHTSTIFAPTITTIYPISHI
jgi:hypothetical protein